MAPLVVLCLLSIGHTAYASNDLVVNVVTDGTYSIKVLGSTWLESAPTYFVTDGVTHSANGNLKLKMTTGTSGSDLFGTWQSTDFHYGAGRSNITTTIKLYPTSQDDFLIFSQHYEDGAVMTNVSSYDDIIGCFPRFQMTSVEKELGYLAFAGDFFGDHGKTFGRFNEMTSDIKHGLRSGPIAIFDEVGHTVIISPFSEFMTASLGFKRNDSIGWGIMGGVKEVPAGYRYDTILYYADGINKAFEGWGRLLRQWYNKTDAFITEDNTLVYMGYWTDNGAYYYYNTEKNRNYEETIFDVFNYANNSGTPYFYYQFDSWWYTKGVGGGTKTWEPQKNVFPEGFKHFQSTTGAQIALHNRYWSSDTTYAIQNGGRYAFVIECNSTVSVPIQEEFWNDIFDKAQAWGLILYEQDWLIWDFKEMESFKTNLILGKTWLTQMASSAQKRGIRIQYSMSHPREAMQSLEFPIVTQARVSGDYKPGHNEQWRIGVVSMFASAMGIRPYKDTFWTTEKQPGNPYNLTEPYPLLNALVSVLSTGPVGPSDGIGYTNRELLMRCCTSNGKILQPGKPATAIDRQVIQRAFDPTYMNNTEIWTTHTVYDAVYHNLYFGTVLVVNPPKGYVLMPQDLDFIVERGEYMYYQYPKLSEIKVFNKTKGLKLDTKCTKSNPCLYHFVQRLDFQFHGNHTYYIIGELDKWTTMSQDRIATITPTMNAELALDILGAPYEDVTITYIEDGVVRRVTCNLGIPGTRGMSLVTGNCPF